MTTPQTTYWHASVRVLTDPMLWRYITSYQRGLPVPLYAFWVAHEPAIARLTGRDVISTGFPRLLRIVVVHGTVQQLEDLSAVKFYRNGPPVTGFGGFYCNRNAYDTGSIVPLRQLAVEFNRADMLQWAITHNTPCEDEQSLWQKALKNHQHGDYRVLDLLRIHHPVSPSWLANRLLTELDDLDLLRWLDEYVPRPVDGRLMKYAVSSGNVAMVEYLLDHHPTFSFGMAPFLSALQKKRVDIARCLVERRQAEFDRGLVERLMLQGHRQAIQIFADVGAFEDIARVIAKTYIDEGKLSQVQRLLDRGLLPSGKPFSIDQAAQNNKLNMIKFLNERNLATATTNAMDWAANYYCWDVVMYLHKHRREGCTTVVMDTAAAHGRFKELRIFHETRSEGCTTRAMDAAAANGYLHVVKFLHENRSEGCTTNAMDDAAGGGQLLVVQYLHSKRTEGCTVAAIEKALKHGHLEVVRFLYQRYRSLFGPEQLHDLLLRGAFDIWMELREVYPDKAAEVVELALLNAGAEKELATIHFIIHELGRTDLAHVAVDGAGLGVFYRHSLWPRVVWDITGPGSCRLSAVRNAVASTYPYAVPHELQFLISVCSETGASEVAIDAAKESHLSYSQPGVVEAWVANGCKLEVPPMHPLLLDPRCPGWAVNLALYGFDSVTDPYNRCEQPLPWAIQAIYRGDRVLLEILKDLKGDDRVYSFEGARAAAIRAGYLPLLQWLLTNSKLPVEPTLLDDALYYHQFEIAEWLVINCLDGCREFNWDNRVDPWWLYLCGLVDGAVLRWIEDHDAVRDLVDFGNFAFHAAKTGDVEALRQLHSTHPEVYKRRQDLAIAAKQHKHKPILAFLKEIEYPFTGTKSRVK